MKYDIIIIGAGAAGLAAMKELLRKGLTVCLLEASDMAGGRIRTIGTFAQPAEAGAEFIHGKLSLTPALLQEAAIPYYETAGDMINVQKGKWLEEQEEDEDWKRFGHQLDQLTGDMTIRQFLDKHFSQARDIRLREKVQRFAEGFDLADINKGSIAGIKKEWAHQEEPQYRIEGGYTRLIDWLLTHCRANHGDIHFNAGVYRVDYSGPEVIVSVTDGRQFTASRVLITVSAGVLKSGSIEFVPALTTHAMAIEQLGFGAVIKILLQFATAFWKEQHADAGFILSDENIPTWWTQLPADSRLLTGWLGGPPALARSALSQQSLLQSSIDALASIFTVSPVWLEQQLTHHHIVCWHNEPFIKGGYSYVTTGTEAAKQVLNHPVDHKVFFAGEAVSQGESLGTVEAAIESGMKAGRKMCE